MAKVTRVFGGIKYFIEAHSSTKRDALEVKKRLKKKGESVRIVYSKRGKEYLVYSR